MKKLLIAIVLLMGLGIVLIIPEPVMQEDGFIKNWDDDDHDYDRARRAVSRGDILPMEQLLDRLQASHPGELVKVELEREDGAWVYEFKVVDQQGRLQEVYMDAKTGDTLKLEDH